MVPTRVNWGRQLAARVGRPQRDSDLLRLRLRSSNHIFAVCRGARALRAQTRTAPPLNSRAAFVDVRPVVQTARAAPCVTVSISLAVPSDSESRAAARLRPVVSFCEGWGRPARCSRAMAILFVHLHGSAVIGSPVGASAFDKACPSVMVSTCRQPGGRQDRHLDRVTEGR